MRKLVNKQETPKDPQKVTEKINELNQTSVTIEKNLFNTRIRKKSKIIYSFADSICDIDVILIDICC